MRLKLMIISCLFIYPSYSVLGQSQNDNSISVFIGLGDIERGLTSNSFEFSYKRQLFSGLYGVVSFAKFSGDQSVSDLIKGNIKIGDRNELGQHIFLNADQGKGDGIFDPDSTPGNLILIRSYSIGLMKYVKIGDKLNLGGSLFTSFSKVSHQYIDGIDYDENDNLIVENIFPTYETYKTVGGKVELELSYFIADHLSIGTSVSYNSSPQIIMLRFGANAWF